MTEYETLAYELGYAIDRVNGARTVEQRAMWEDEADTRLVRLNRYVRKNVS